MTRLSDASLLATASALAVTLAAYPTARLVARLLAPEPSPLLPVGDGPIAFFVRCLVALYLGVLSWVPLRMAAHRSATAAWKTLPALWSVALLLLMLQVLFVP